MSAAGAVRDDMLFNSLRAAAVTPHRAARVPNDFSVAEEPRQHMICGGGEIVHAPLPAFIGFTSPASLGIVIEARVDTSTLVFLGHTGRHYK